MEWLIEQATLYTDLNKERVEAVDGVSATEPSMEPLPLSPTELASLISILGQYRAEFPAHSGLPTQRPLYDWFVHAINLSPIGDLLLRCMDRLTEWGRRVGNRSKAKSHSDASESNHPVDYSSPHRTEIKV